MMPKNDTSRPANSSRKSRCRRSGVMSTVASWSQDGTGRKHETLDRVTYSIVARDTEDRRVRRRRAVALLPGQPRRAVGARRRRRGGDAVEVNLSYGPLGLELLQAGYTRRAGAEGADRRRSAGRGPPVRHRRRRAATSRRTPARSASPPPATRVGDGFSCQANLMERDTVWDAMAEAFERDNGPARRADDGRARRGRGRRWRHPRQAVGGDARGGRQADRPLVGGPDHRPARRGRCRAAARAAPAAPDQARLHGRRARPTSLDEAGDQAPAAKLRTRRSRIAPEMVELRFWSGHRDGRSRRPRRRDAS